MSGKIRGLTSKVSTAKIKEFVAKLTVIPDTARNFDSSLAEATNTFRIPLQLIDLLTESGFPHRGSGNDRTFDQCDLRSTMLHLGCGSVGLAMRRFWPTALNHHPETDPLTYEITLQSDCWDSRDSNECEVSFYLPGGYTKASERTPSGTACTRFLADIPAQWPELGERERALIDSVAELEFMWLPDSLRGDDKFMRRTGLGDCLSVAEILNETAGQYGLTARVSQGLIITPPFAAPHYWTDVLMGERWVPIDPLMVKAMIEWGALRTPEWDIYRSTGRAVLRLGPAEWQPLTLHSCGSLGEKIGCGLVRDS